MFTKPKKEQPLDLTIPDVIYAVFRDGCWPICRGSSSYYRAECDRYDSTPHRGHSVLVYEDRDQAMSSAKEGDMLIAFRRSDNFVLSLKAV